MNKLPLQKRVQILNMLVEGSSMRSISRVVDVSINTVSKLLVDAGNACAAYHYEHVRDVKAERVQCDEIWSFVYSKAKNTPTAKAAPYGAGDVWTWTALDSGSKLILSWLVGDRSASTANVFVDDLASRLANRIQLTTDGYRVYLDAVAGAFEDDINYAMLVKLYGEDPNAVGPERKYSPGDCVGTRKEPITGNPDRKHISTSHVERHNLTMRMQMKRFGRLTNAFSKKVDNHIHALSLYFVWYNFCRQHKAHKLSPAMAAGVTDRLWSMEDIADLIEARAPKPGRRGPYKKSTTA
jgi:IS1 family transposase